jgi:hypothetical protein
MADRRLLRRPSPPIVAAARSSGRPRPSSSPDIPTGSCRALLGEGFGGATVDGLMANCDGCGFMATLQRREPLPADGEVELHRQWHVQIVSRRFVSLSLTHRIPFTLHQFGKKRLWWSASCRSMCGFPELVLVFICLV